MMISLELLDCQIVFVPVVFDQIHSVGGIEVAVEEGTGEKITAVQIILIKL